MFLRVPVPAHPALRLVYRVNVSESSGAGSPELSQIKGY